MAFYNRNVTVEGKVDFGAMRAQVTTLSTADTTTSMDSSANYYMRLDGTNAGRKVNLPNATTLSLGHTYTFVNQSSRIVPIYKSDGTALLESLIPGATSLILLTDNTAANGGWVFNAISSAGVASFSFFGSYNANAAVGRYLEIYPSVASDTAPYLVTGAAAIVALSLGNVSLSTGTMGVFKTSDLVNPIGTISLSNQLNSYTSGLYLPVAAGSGLALSVTAGTFSKPYLTVYLVSAASS